MLRMMSRCSSPHVETDHPGRRSLLGAKCSESRGDSDCNHRDKAHAEPRIGSAPFIHARHDSGHARVGLPAPLTVRWIHASIAMHRELLVNGIRQHNEQTTGFLPRIGSSPFIKARRDSARGPQLAHAPATASPEVPSAAYPLLCLCQLIGRWNGVSYPKDWSVLDRWMLDQSMNPIPPIR